MKETGHTKAQNVQCSCVFPLLLHVTPPPALRREATNQRGACAVQKYSARVGGSFVALVSDALEWEPDFWSLGYNWCAAEVPLVEQTEVPAEPSWEIHELALLPAVKVSDLDTAALLAASC